MESKMIRKVVVAQDIKTGMLYIDQSLSHYSGAYVRLFFELVPKSLLTKVLAFFGLARAQPIGYEVSVPGKTIADFLTQTPGRDKIVYSGIVQMPLGDANLRIWIQDPKTPKKWVMRTYIDRLYS